jgi:HSP20 family protein
LSEEKVKVAPTVYMSHDEKEYSVEVELPGIKKEEINLDVAPNGFCVSAPRENIEYSQCYTLTHEIDPEKIYAKYESGLLKFKLPLKQALKSKRIAVK